ncbi:4-hydroxythreonine-4-phosphate dehydrogenase PdxA [Bergeyella porcorum]|uniref:4-hydroxythreonine-4-phosphate dehydrogenase PdxA n=1 Tax=Bergeyella porcorum TaxID=1735111 RepID=A0AAU0F1F9_9FLAO
MSSKHPKIKIGFSVGDFNGIGPEIIMKALKDKHITDFFTPIIFASGKLFTYQKNIFKLNLNFNYITEASQAQAGKLNMVNLWKDNVNVELGSPTEESTRMAIDSLEAATNALINGDIDILVTAPINKDEMMKQGFKHAGHTGFFEEKFGKKGLMFLVTEDLKVAVSTHHIPISEVAQNISKEKIKKQIKLLHQTLIEDFQIVKPKIAVLGLNPHAG